MRYKILSAIAEWLGRVSYWFETKHEDLYYYAARFREDTRTPEQKEQSMALINTAFEMFKRNIEHSKSIDRSYTDYSK